MLPVLLYTAKAVNSSSLKIQIMKLPYLAAVSLGLLLSACGVSSSDQQKMSDDFRNKFTALYLVPGAPGMVENVECSNFEKGSGLAGVGAYHATFSATHIGDDSRALIHGDVCFDENGYVTSVDSTHLAVFIVTITKLSPKCELEHSKNFDEYLPSQIPY